MELRHLRYFVAVAEELHFRRAAERLHVSQPVVSDQIRKLEVELGVRLLDRSPRAVTLTDPGEAMLVEARRVLRQAELARLIARSTRDGAVIRLRVGYVPASLPVSIPLALQRLAGSLSRLDTTLEPGRGLELIEAVRHERLDAAIVSLPAPVADLRVTPLGPQRMVAALPFDHRQAAEPSLRLDRLAPQRLVVLPREADRPVYDAIVGACHDAGLAPTFVETLDGDVEQALLAVAGGGGVAVLPEPVAERYAPRGISFVPLEGDQPVVQTAVVTQRESTHLPTAAFLRAVRAVQLARTSPRIEPRLSASG